MSDRFDEPTNEPEAVREETTRGGSNEADYAFWNTAEEPAGRAPRWRTGVAVALLLGLIAAVTFVVVGALIDRKPAAVAPAPTPRSAANSPSPSPSSTSSSPASTSSSSSAPNRSTQSVVPAPAETPRPSEVQPTQSAPPTQEPKPDPTPSTSQQPSVTSSPSDSVSPGEPEPFPATTGRHCRTASGAPTSTTEADVRQSLKASSSCAFLVGVRDAVHAHTAANGRDTAFSLHLFSAYRKQQQPETDGYVDLTCTPVGTAFVECTAQNPSVDIWVRDAA